MYSWLHTADNKIKSHFWCVRKTAKATVSIVMSFRLYVCLSVRPHGTTRLPLNRFSFNLIFGYISKIYRENSSLIKI
jgi:hypothetical protein